MIQALVMKNNKNKSDKLFKIKFVKALEAKLDMVKNRFDSLVKKIQNQNKSVIHTFKNSFRFSNFSITAIQKENINKNKPFQNAKEFLEDKVEERSKQNELISE